MENTAFEPGLLSVLPPVIAILLAIFTKQVYLSLFVGVIFGSLILSDFNLLHGFAYALEKHLVKAIADPFHGGIILFTLVIGGTIQLVISMGGAKALALKVIKLCHTVKATQLAVFFTGLLVFFDDYSNSLIVGPTMRPVTDRMKISREKLAYLVDSTSAPIAGMALLSTWIGMELSLIEKSFQGTESVLSGLSAYEIFLKSIPYRFYDIFAIAFVIAVCVLGRDFGPMLKAEKRARAGQVSPDTEASTQDDEEEKIEKPKAINAVLPILTLVVFSLFGFWYTGGGAKQPDFSFASIRDVLSNADASLALLWGAIASSIVAIALAVSQKIMTVEKAFNSWLKGTQAILGTVLILILAWALGSLTKDLKTAEYLIEFLKNSAFPVERLPIIVFLVSCLVSFSTGSSWGTMTIMIPIVVPLVLGIEAGAVGEEVILAALASVLTGSIFGDHCSPISDTTILASTATSCHHMEHVRTQVPYALLTAGITIVFGYLPVMIGLPVWIGLILGVVSCFVAMRVLGKKSVP